MEIHFLVHLYLFLSIFLTAHGMDPVPPQKKDKQRRSTYTIASITPAAAHHQPSSEKKLARTASLHSLTSKNTSAETGKIKAINSDPLNIQQTHSKSALGNKLQTYIRKNESGKIAQFLADPENDPNHPYFSGKNTLLHKCVLAHNDTIANILCRDFRTYSLIENEFGRTAYECLIEKNVLVHPQLYIQLRDRACLDLIVDALIMNIDKLTKDPYDDKFLSKMVIFLRTKIPVTIFPEYATLSFVVAMLKHRMPKKNLVMQILYDNPTLDELHTKIQHALYLHDEEFLNTNNPNILYGPEQNSLLHIFAEECAEPKIMLFLANPHITVLVKNKKGLKPSECVKKEVYQNLSKEFLLRETLDTIVHAIIVTNETIIQKKRDDKITKQKIKQLLTRLPSHILPSYATVSFILTMIKAQLRYYRDALLNTYLQYQKDHNYQDAEGNTHLHQAVYLRDKDMVTLLVEKAHVTCLKKNNSGLLPQGLLYSLEQHPEIRALLFMRDSLERWAMSTQPFVLELMQITNPSFDIDTLTMNTDGIQEAIQGIKDKAKRIKEKQMVENGTDEDGQLPTVAADLPEYANDTFLFELIKFCLLERRLKK